MTLNFVSYAPTQKMTTQLLEGTGAIRSLAEEWESLVGDSFSAVYSRPDWYLAWCDAFQQRQVTVVTARSDGRLVGVLPFARNRTDARGLYFTQIGPFAIGDYHAPILDPTFASVALPPMLDTVFAHLGRYGAFWWPHIPTTDPTLDVLRSYLKMQGMPYTEKREPTPRLRLAGRDFCEVEKTWNANHRKDVRRQRKRLSEQGPLSLWQPPTLPEAEGLLDEFFRLHSEYWLARNYPARFQQPRMRQYYRALVRRFWGRGLHFSTVRCGQLNVSYHLGFFSGGWLHWYCPTYRAEFSAYSPGKIHVALLIEEGCRSRWNGIDFLLGDEPYKMLWANEQREVVTIHAGFRRWAPSYLWFAHGKPYVRRRLALLYFNMKAGLQKLRPRVC